MKVEMPLKPLFLGLNKGIPHTRGDEPKPAEGVVLVATVFPTHVGMNRK